MHHLTNYIMKVVLSKHQINLPFQQKVPPKPPPKPKRSADFRSSSGEKQLHTPRLSDSRFHIPQPKALPINPVPFYAKTEGFNYPQAMAMLNQELDKQIEILKLMEQDLMSNSSMQEALQEFSEVEQELEKRRQQRSDRHETAQKQERSVKREVKSDETEVTSSKKLDAVTNEVSKSVDTRIQQQTGAIKRLAKKAEERETGKQKWNLGQELRRRLLLKQQEQLKAQQSVSKYNEKVKNSAEKLDLLIEEMEKYLEKEAAETSTRKPIGKFEISQEASKSTEKTHRSCLHIDKLTRFPGQTGDTSGSASCTETFWPRPLSREERARRISESQEKVFELARQMNESKDPLSDVQLEAVERGEKQNEKGKKPLYVEYYYLGRF